MGDGEASVPPEEAEAACKTNLEEANDFKPEAATAFKARKNVTGIEGSRGMWMQDLAGRNLKMRPLIRLQSKFRQSMACRFFSEAKLLAALRAGITRERFGESYMVSEFLKRTVEPHAEVWAEIFEKQGLKLVDVAGAGRSAWRERFLRLYNGALRLQTRCQRGYHYVDKTDPTCGVIALFGQMVATADIDDPYRPFVLRIDSTDHTGEMALLSFGCLHEREDWRQLLEAAVEAMENTIMDEMRFAHAWLTHEFEPHSLHLLSAYERYLEQLREQPDRFIELQFATPKLQASGPSARRRALESMLLMYGRLERPRTLLSSFFCIKGGALWKLTKSGTKAGHTRHFRLVPSKSLLVWDGAEPQLVLGGIPGMSAATARSLKPSARVAQRAFRFVLVHSEITVVAATEEEKQHWLLALRSLPIGAEFYNRMRCYNQYGLYEFASAAPHVGSKGRGGPLPPPGAQTELSAREAPGDVPR